MQTAIIDFCRDVLELPQADSEEFNKDALDKVIVFMPEINTQMKGGTMRLGNRATIFRDPTSLACRIYNNTPVIYERHRHR
jgi:CTP synthase